MGVDRATVLKRCRSLDLDPAYVGKTVKKNRKGRNASKGNRKVSEYGLQLAEKQKVKFIYGVQEKQFRTPVCLKELNITVYSFLVVL